jgi:hypothetical protein
VRTAALERVKIPNGSVLALPRADDVFGKHRVLPAQDRVLVTQDQDLYIFGRAGTGEESEPAGDAAEHKVEQAQRHT